MTEKQFWARKRNWLIMRLMGAASIFSYENEDFMNNALRENADGKVQRCRCAIDDLIDAMRSTKCASE